MNTAAASWVSGSAKLPPIWNTIRNANAFFRKLSLNAEKNWHQNRGAKRRDSKRDLDAAGDGSVMGEAYAKNARVRPASCAATGESNIDKIPQNNRGRTSLAWVPRRRQAPSINSSR